MPTSEDDVLARIRDLFLEAIGERDSTRAREDRIMSHLKDLIENGQKLAAERAALIADRDAQKARADKAEAQIAADDETARAAKEALDAEIAKEAGLDAAGAATGDGTPEPVPSTSPTGAAVTVDPAAGTTTHTDAAGFTTTLDHASGAATATDADGEAVEPHPEAVTEARDAASAAGVAVPVAEAPIPTTVG